MDEKPYFVGLTIRHRGKGIPYGGHGEPRPDGTANYGFKNLKGNLHMLDDVPELQSDPAMHDLVRTINQPETGLVSVGCGTWPVTEEQGHRWQGYIEFAINSAKAITDARSYFYVFFHFDKLLHETEFKERVTYRWELEGAHFLDSKADGFTCTVWVYTSHFRSVEEAKEAWHRALEPLIPLFEEYPEQEGAPLFPPQGAERG